jgi:hypothetical protein
MELENGKNKNTESGEPAVYDRREIYWKVTDFNLLYRLFEKLSPENTEREFIEPPNMERSAVTFESILAGFLFPPLYVYFDGDDRWVPLNIQSAGLYSDLYHIFYMKDLRFKRLKIFRQLENKSFDDFPLQIQSNITRTAVTVMSTGHKDAAKIFRHINGEKDTLWNNVLICVQEKE